jgi:CubicO group peptidase (beta-lactamase class C family)
MTTPLQIQGQCDSRFTAVREAFAENFAKRAEVGAAVSVYVDGKPLVTSGAATPTLPGLGPGNRTRL